MAKSAGKRTTGRKRTAKQIRDRNRMIRDNVLLVGISVLCILLFASLMGLGGLFGVFAGQVQFGTFGICAWAFPFLLLGLTIYLYVKRGREGKAFVPVILVILYVLLCLLLQLFTGSYSENGSILTVISYSITYHRGGGLVGGGLEMILRSLIGLIGTCLTDIAGIILCVVALTGRSFVDAVGEGSGKAYRSSKDAVEKQKEKWDTRRLERAQRNEHMRMDHVVSGVSMDLTVEGAPSAAEEEPAEDFRDSWTGIDDDHDYATEDRPSDRQKESQQSDEMFFPEDPEPADIPEMPNVSADPDAAILSGGLSAAGPDDSSAAAQALSEKPYVFPPLSLLHKDAHSGGDSERTALANKKKLQDTLSSFGVDVRVTGFEQGPTVTRYELLPAAGVKVSKILALTDDIKLALAAADVRIEAPIPGKSAIGIEVPNSKRVTIGLRELLETKAFQTHKSKIVFAAGKDISGNVILADIQKMPHLLIAGATGSGKSVCINTIVMSILYHADPKEVRLIMIDPKVVELSVYNGIPHLYTPVVTDPKKAAGALNWAVQEMTRRYQLFSEEHVRDISAYNEKARQNNASKTELTEVLPQIVIIVDELADLMMVAPGEVEDAICRLAQLARAAGLHLVIATQRPSVNVITGLIKANMPSRIAFSVSSGVDSRTILDMNGAEKLLGNGDMLYYPQGYAKPLRVQGAFVTDEEVSAVVNFLKENNEEVNYHQEVADHELPAGAGSSAGAADGTPERDTLFEQAGRFLIESEKGSIGSLQRKFRIGFNRAARIVDQLTEAGVLGPEEGTKARQVLMTKEEFEEKIAGGGQGANADY